MTQGERVCAIRKEKEMTMERFGEIIGIQKSAVSKIEKDKVNLTEANIKAICREFNVSENWLRTGDGKMFVPLDRNDEIAKLTSDLFKSQKNSFKERLILALSRLNESEWEILEKIAEEIAKEKD